MKITILSDIHSNYEALKSVLKKIEKIKPDKIYNLGDIIGYGANPSKVIELIKSFNIISVKGNHDLAITNDKIFNLMHSNARKSLTINKSLLKDSDLEFINSLPENISENNMLFVHGCPPKNVMKYLFLEKENLENLFSLFNEKFCFFGHTHIHQIAISDKKSYYSNYTYTTVKYQENWRIMLNCGSVGQPRNNEPFAQFVEIDTNNQQINIHKIEYDIQKEINDIINSGLPTENATRLLYGI